jgi:hypothetical protein
MEKYHSIPVILQIENKCDRKGKKQQIDWDISSN